MAVRVGSPARVFLLPHADARYMSLLERPKGVLERLIGFLERPVGLLERLEGLLGSPIRPLGKALWKDPMAREDPREHRSQKN